MNSSELENRKSFIPLCIYLLACIMPIFKDDYTPDFSALLMGWMGVLGYWPVFLSWVANFFFLAAYVIPAKRKTERIICSFFSVLLGLTFLAVKEIPETEGGTTMLAEPGIAFWFWIASFVYLLFEITGNKSHEDTK